jgi:hypothetical protein
MASQIRATSLAKAKATSRCVLSISLMVSAVSRLETWTTVGVRKLKSWAARMRARGETLPTICGRWRSSGSACPSSVRSGQKATS